ncbi:MAG: hypothetical protein EpisKO_05980 [Epibacterium sp.]
MQMKNVILTLIFCGVAAGCTEMTDYYPDAKTIEIEGREFFVAARPQNGKNVYLAGPNQPKLAEAVYSADFSLPALNVTAIETVTGCKAIPATVNNIESGITYAAVECPN